MALDDLGFIIKLGATELVPSMKSCFENNPFGYEEMINIFKEWGVRISDDDFDEYHKTAIWILKIADMASGMNMFHHAFNQNVLDTPDVIMLVSRGKQPVNIVNDLGDGKDYLTVEFYVLASRRLYFNETRDWVDVGFAIPVTYVLERIGGRFHYGFHSDGYSTVTLGVSLDDLSYLNNWQHCISYEYGKIHYDRNTEYVSDFLKNREGTFVNGTISNWYTHIFDTPIDTLDRLKESFNMPLGQISADIGVSTIPGQVASLFERNIKSLRKLNRLLNATLSPLDEFDVDNASISIKGDYGDGTITFRFNDGKILELPFKCEIEVASDDNDDMNRLVFAPNTFLRKRESRRLSNYNIYFNIGTGSNCTSSDSINLFNAKGMEKLHSEIDKAARNSSSDDVCLAGLPWMSTAKELKKLFENGLSNYFISNSGFDPIYDSLLKLFYSSPDALASLFASGIQFSASKIRQFAKTNKKQIQRTGLGNKENVTIPKVAQRNRGTVSRRSLGSTF